MQILLADATATPVIRALDITGIFNRYFLSKYVATQDEMDILWTPSDWSLAERYTDALKTLFVGLFYAVPLPAGLFITCFAMISTFYVDRYSLVRIWRRPPNFSDSLSSTAKSIFLATIFAHTNLALRCFANWPYGGASKANCTFFVCGTNSNMTTDQKTIVSAYNALNILIFVLVIGRVFLLRFIHFIITVLYVTEDSGATQGIDNENSRQFRELTSVSAYVPLIEPVELANPVFAVDLSQVPVQFAPLVQDTTFDSSGRKSVNDHTPNSFSVVNQREFPQVSQAGFRTLFSQIKFYESKVLASHFSAAPATSAVKHINSGVVLSTASPPLMAEMEMGITKTKTPGDLPQVPLPPGWTMKTDAQGNTYYSNSITKTTSWDRPS
jgi:hypothetical protein